MRYQQPYGVIDPTGNAPYVNGDPSIGRQGSIPPAAAFEQPMREIVQCIVGTGIVPSDDDLTQLWQAMQIAPWIQEYAIDTGSANVYSAALNPAPTQLYPGMMVSVKISNDNSGPSTLNINGLGAHAIKRATGANLNAGDMRAGQVARFVFDGSYFQLVNFLGFTSDTTINNFTLLIPYAVDSGAVNSVVGIFNPAVTVLAAGNPFLVKVSNTCTGPVTMKANALASAPLVWPDGTLLAAGDIVSGGLIFIVFDGSKFQLMCRINGGAATPPTPPTTTTGVPGTLDIWPTETPPTGALECDGKSYLRADYPRLFGIIGTRYGSVDATHFNVPDMRGQFVRGWSHSSGADPDAATRTNRGDGVTGDSVGTRQGSTFGTHAHNIPPGGIGGSGLLGGPGQTSVPNTFPYYGQTGFPSGQGDQVIFGNWGVGMGWGYTDSQGGKETRPVNVALMFIIWT